METKLCACGCGTLIPVRTKHGDPARFVKGHGNRGRTFDPAMGQKISATRKANRAPDFTPKPFWKRYTDPHYAPWRLAVLERDRWTCQHCGHVGTPKERGFAAHHRKEWAKYQALRFEVSNGLTLCRPCHMALHGQIVEPRVQVPCACGCDELVCPPNRYVNHHATRGKKWSAETLERMRQAKLGKRMSAEARANMSASRKGKKQSPEWIAARIAGRKPIREDVRSALIERNKRPMSAETKAKISVAKTGRTASSETKAKMSLASKGKPKSPEHRAALTAARRERRNRKKAPPLSKLFP